MPIYEFYCPQNNTLYSFLARQPGMAGAVPRCPDDPSLTMEKRVSSFAVLGAEKKSGHEPDDAALEAAMGSLESEFAGMDEENPDPKQLGRLMRRMGELTGQDLGGPMEEMIARLERGEDPDSLEEEYGDALDDAFPEGDPEAPELGPHKTVRDRLRRFRQRRAPKRDPKIYDLADHI